MKKPTKLYQITHGGNLHKYEVTKGVALVDMGQGRWKACISQGGYYAKFFEGYGTFREAKKAKLKQLDGLIERQVFMREVVSSLTLKQGEKGGPS